MTKTCNKCAECCRWLIIKIPKGDKLIEEYYRARGCLQDGEYILIPSICPQLDEHNLCSIHENKPAICRNFNGPGPGYYIHDKCVWSKNV